MVWDALDSLYSWWWLPNNIILSPARLPFHHSGTEDSINNEAPTRIQERVYQRGDNGPFRRAVSSTPVMNSRRLA